MTRVRNRRGETVIRQLKAGDSIPSDEPRRYISGNGYVRLRWRTGPGEYVEAYEHRLVAGLPDGEVHHRDGNKLNNAPENLVVTAKDEHARVHGAVASARSKRATEWDGQRSRAAFEKRQRRLAREAARAEFVSRIVAMRRAGLTTVEIGRRVGRDPSNITRALQSAERHAKQAGEGFLDRYYPVRYERSA